MEIKSSASPTRQRVHQNNQESSASLDQRTDERSSLAAFFLNDEDQCRFYGFLKIIETGVPCCCQIDNLGYFRLFDGTEFHELYLPNMKITAMDDLYLSMDFLHAREVSRSRPFQFEARCHEVREKWMSALADSGAVIGASTVGFAARRHGKALPDKEKHGDNASPQRPSRPLRQQRAGAGGNSTAKKAAGYSKDKETNAAQQASKRSDSKTSLRDAESDYPMGLIRKTPVAFIQFQGKRHQDARDSTEWVSEAARSSTPSMDELFVIPRFPPSPVLLRVRHRNVRTSVYKNVMGNVGNGRAQGLGSHREEKGVALKDQIDAFQKAANSGILHGSTALSSSEERSAAEEGSFQLRTPSLLSYPAELDARVEATSFSKTPTLAKKGGAKETGSKAKEQELSPWTNELSPRSPT
ncbi:hypothetical protein GUITHDRAFT_137783 [Guillardia theta CCMP2712]|uniref:Uncharacterized protein n=1 Tax=Guillardia theta (strain CCMP2712) TaxID=905079 RepID=L1JFU4_GUITC|nr:hypothetical protein GUITHDRAFT_137783 [Guillardia theta CCMP2712]EKX47197.1 hypothetical protein GUITHDRAFT_137783 [Guillardia theta CCMP2712]|eukprot:XP_005834177.1 hypothetical protein GUITHDRAFT_137783 [Guillardia theta CCMP2712]